MFREQLDQDASRRSMVFKEHLLSGELWDVNQLDIQGRISKTLIPCISRIKSLFGGLAQLARAPALHAGGQRFESVILHLSLET